MYDQLKVDRQCDLDVEQLITRSSVDVKMYSIEFFSDQRHQKQQKAVDLARLIAADAL